jgi:polar amino acid transport system substrate-binding protein
MGRILLSIAWLAALSGVAFGQTAYEIAPGGKLRVGMIAITVLGGLPRTNFLSSKSG